MRGCDCHAGNPSHNCASFNSYQPFDQMCASLNWCEPLDDDQWGVSSTNIAPSVPSMLVLSLSVSEWCQPLLEAFPNDWNDVPQPMGVWHVTLIDPLALSDMCRVTWGSRSSNDWIIIWLICVVWCGVSQFCYGHELGFLCELILGLGWIGDKQKVHLVFNNFVSWLYLTEGKIWAQVKHNNTWAFGINWWTWISQLALENSHELDY